MGTSSVACITQSCLTAGESVQDHLLAAVDVRDATNERFKDFAEIVGIDFTDSHFSFSVASSVVKGLQSGESCSAAVKNLLVTLATGQSRRHLRGSNGSAKGDHPLDVLGYLVALLPVASKELDSFTMKDLQGLVAGSGVPASCFDYTPLLAELDVDSNEPLVLAASLCMSLLHVADTDSVQTALLSFLQEIADISPTVLQLLENRLLPILTEWIRTSHAANTSSLAAPMLSFLLANPSDKRTNDISTYVTALGFPALLDCARWSFGGHPDQLIERFQCCADLIDAILEHPPAEKR